MEFYHNPRCRKSREALSLLEEKGVTPEIILYLKDVPTESELEGIVSKLGIKPFDLVRKGETIYKETLKGRELSDSQWVKTMIENPKLIERPILVNGDKAVIGRPAEDILTIL